MTEHKAVPPAWLVAAVDQRMQLLTTSVGHMADQYPIILTTLTEPAAGSTQGRWERTCDNCGTYCPDDAEFFTGNAIRDLHGTQVVITYGACRACSGVID